jgi:uncharacterized membrane protein YgcG
MKKTLISAVLLCMVAAATQDCTAQVSVEYGRVRVTRNRSRMPLPYMYDLTTSVMQVTEVYERTIEFHSECDGTCNRGNPCLCPIDCKCRKPNCKGKNPHIMKVSMEQVEKELKSIGRTITSKHGGSLGGDLSGKISGSAEGGGKASGGAGAKGKIEGYEKTESTEKRQSSERQAQSTAAELGDPACAHPGQLKFIHGKLTITVTLVYERVRTVGWWCTPLTGSDNESEHLVRETTIALKVENKSTVRLCPCTRKLPKGSATQPMPEGKGKGTGGGKAQGGGGVFLGGDKDRSSVAIRDKDGKPLGEDGSGYKVRVDGKEVDQDQYKVSVGTKDPSVAVVTMNHSYQPAMGATITVIDPKGTEHVTQRPPDKTQIVNRVTVNRGKSSTKITIIPRVRTQTPDGDVHEHPPGQEPTGTPPGVFLTDDKGFWGGLFEFFEKTASGVLIPVATGYLLNPGTGSTTIINQTPEGATEIEIPNDAYDSAIDTAQKIDPDFGASDVANTVQTGTGLSQSPNSEFTGLNIVRYYVIGGTPFDLHNGGNIVFIVNLGDAKLSATLEVLLAMGGVTLGCLRVDQVSPMANNSVSVSTTLVAPPPGEEAFYASIRLDGKTSNPVPLQMAQGSVSIVALQKTVVEGGTIELVLNAEGGSQRIRGTLSISGPGSFVPQGGQSIEVDATGSISFKVQSSDPGLIHATFTPSEDGGTDELKKDLSKDAGFSKDAFKLD